LPSSIKPIANFIASFLTTTSSPTSSSLHYTAILSRARQLSGPEHYARENATLNARSKLQVERQRRKPDRMSEYMPGNCQKYARQGVS